MQGSKTEQNSFCFLPRTANEEKEMHFVLYCTGVYQVNTFLLFLTHRQRKDPHCQSAIKKRISLCLKVLWSSKSKLRHLTNCLLDRAGVL